MTGEQPCGYKLPAVFGLQHKLPRVKRTAGSAWTRLSAGVGSIKPPEIAVALSNAPGLFGGRSASLVTNEHTTHGGIVDE